MLKEVGKRMGWAPRWVRLLTSLIIAYPHCVLIIDGFAMWLWSTMLSGVMSTDLINGIITWLLLCMAFHFLVQACFRYFVSVACLGDDHIGGVAPEVRSAFNPAAIAQFMGICGHVYTAADKTLNFENYYIDREKASFL